MLATKGYILTRENFHIFFGTSFKKCYGLFCLNLISTMEKKMWKVKKKLKTVIFKKKIIFVEN